MMSALVAALHFVAAFGVVATVFSEWVIFNRTLTLAEARRIQRCDAWYGICATFAVVAGLLRVYFFEKGSHFYLSNWVFLIKIGLFVTVGLLSIYPTMQFIGWRKATRANEAPTLTDRRFAVVQRLLRLEVLLLVGMIIAASLMAKGVGQS